MRNEERVKPHSLFIMESLNNRSLLLGKCAQYYSSLKKGWEGEKQFDKMLEMVECDHIILKDMLFKVNGTVFQIDSILITNKTLYLYEVKNYEGEYLLAKNRLINHSTNREVLNPAIQLERTKTLLRQLLGKYGMNLTIEAYVVFINGRFTLYQLAPDQFSFLLPTMIATHIDIIGRNNEKLKKRHYECVSFLNHEQMKDTPYLDLPEYTYEFLIKGMLCYQCQSRIPRLTGRLIICPTCLYKETARLSVQRHVEEFIRLFPKRKVTTAAIKDWCDEIPSPYTIRAAIKTVKSNREIGEKYFEGMKKDNSSFK